MTRFRRFTPPPQLEVQAPHSSHLTDSQSSWEASRLAPEAVDAFALPFFAGLDLQEDSTSGDYMRLSYIIPLLASSSAVLHPRVSPISKILRFRQVAPMPHSSERI